MLSLNVCPTDLVKVGGRQLCLVRCSHSGKPKEQVLSVKDGKTSFDIQLTIPSGDSEHWFDVAVKQQRRTVHVISGDQKQRIVVEPPKRRVIHLINHTHTDVGYTDFQPTIRHEFYEFVLEAMALVDETKTFPEESKFRFTIETVFHIRNFLERASQKEIKRLIAHVKRGTLAIGSLNFQMTDMSSTDQLQQAYRFLLAFSREHGLKLGPALGADINGLPWHVPTVLSDLGVHNLSMCVNPAMAREPLTRPLPFWWEAPDGKRVLVWNSEGYCVGNGCNLEFGVDEAMAPVADHLKKLREMPFPYEHASMFMSGVRIDSAPPTIHPCVTAREWNAQFENPKLQIATLSDWFVQVRKMIGKEVPTYRKHWPDYWAHGLGSAVDEIRYARETQHLLPSAGVAAALASMQIDDCPFPTETLNDAYYNAALSLEHTWGAACSIGSPYCDVTKIQWQYKRDHFYRARMDSEGVLRRSLENIGRRVCPDSPCVVVHNALPWKRSGIAELDVIRRPMTGYRLEGVIDPRTGKEADYWHEPQDNTIWHYRLPMKNIPATGYVTLPSVSRDVSSRLAWADVSKPDGVIENAFYRVKVDARRGEITSIYDKKLGKELVRNNKHLPFGCVIHEQTSSPKVREWADRSDRKPRIDEKEFRPVLAQGGKLKKREIGGICQELLFAGKCNGLNSVQTVLRLYEDEKRIDLTWRLDLPSQTDPHAGYVAFPFAGRKPRTWIEVPGGPMEPGVDQIPTTCYDFYTAQNFVHVETESAALTLVPRDTPLVEFNDIASLRYREQCPKFNGVVVSWLFNNYWVTNFPTSQPGEHVFRFSLTSGTKRSHTMASSYRFAYEVANPLRAHFVTDSALKRHLPESDVAGEASLVSIKQKNVMLTSVSRASNGEGYALRIQEVTGKATTACLQFSMIKPKATFVGNLFEAGEKKIAVRDDVRVLLRPFEAKAVRVVL